MAQDRERRKGKGGANDKRRIPKKKTSILTSERIDWIVYKDVNLLRRFMSERAKIRARRVVGTGSLERHVDGSPQLAAVSSIATVTTIAAPALAALRHLTDAVGQERHLPGDADRLRHRDLLLL